MKRVPHGVGTWKAMDKKSSRYADDEFSFYYGEWYDGCKHGYGIEIDDSGIYAGNFVDGYRNGQGRIDFANGTTLISNFSVLQQHADRHKGAFRNPYMNGDANGYAEVLYADGGGQNSKNHNNCTHENCLTMLYMSLPPPGLFKGVMAANVPDGPGEYESAFAEKLKGNFKDGCLHGENGFFKNYADEKFFGNLCVPGCVQHAQKHIHTYTHIRTRTHARGHTHRHARAHKYRRAQICRNRCSYMRAQAHT